MMKLYPKYVAYLTKGLKDSFPGSTVTDMVLKGDVVEVELHIPMPTHYCKVTIKLPEEMNAPEDNGEGNMR